MGLISDYNKSVRRFGKLHYEVSIDLSLTQKQVNGVLRRASGEGEDVNGLSEEKKGRVKFICEVEINKALMEMMKEGMKNMPMMGKWRHMAESETK
ncbi:MAG: hypothetical protein QG670_2274 [Thermoproteota archaeon]|nr:hypothetical protein [Thermoproteota archaeon]